MCAANHGGGDVNTFYSKQELHGRRLKAPDTQNSVNQFAIEGATTVPRNKHDRHMCAKMGSVSAHAKEAE